MNEPISLDLFGVLWRLGATLFFVLVVEDQLFLVALGLITNGVALIQPLAAGFLHQQFPCNEFIEKLPFAAGLLVARSCGTGQLSPADVEFSLGNGASVHQRDDGFFFLLGRAAREGQAQQSGKGACEEH